MWPTARRSKPAQGWGRWSGLRAQLLVLLLPSVALMMGINSWSDYEERIRTLESAYDEALLEPLSVLDESVRIGDKGDVDFAVPFAVQAMFESIQALHKHLHVGLLPLDAGATARERTLMGPDDLPAPPPSALLKLAPTSLASAHVGRIALYTASYRGYPIRVATSQRELQDVLGRRYLLRVQAAESMDRRTDALQASLRREFRQDLYLLVVTAILVWLGITWALQPLKRLRTSLRTRSRHDLQALDASNVPHEVAPLVDAVNHHIADYRQLLGEQGRFLEDASHQLRTPLAIMMAQAGYALREQDPAILRETLRAILAQLERSRRLSDQLLAMAHASLLDDADAELPLMDLNAVAREVVLQYLPLAHEKDQDLGWVDWCDEDVPVAAEATGLAAPVRARAAEIHEALANLVHNAIHYTPRGGRITVSVRVEGDCALAEVVDGGPGIAAGSHEAVFERFSRGKSAVPGGTSPGSGLGLAIARSYARRNGGNIVLSDARELSVDTGSGTGLCARLTLPLAVLH